MHNPCLDLDAIQGSVLNDLELDPIVVLDLM